MIKFFRRIRKKLLSENRFSKYLLYAIGEIILVVIGILIALSVNNWNEKRKLDAQFATVIEQIYNSILFDVEQFRTLQNDMERRREIAAYLLTVPEDSINTSLIGVAFQSFSQNNVYHSETPFFLEKLHPDPDDVIHNELMKEINNYVNRLQTVVQGINRNAYQMVINAGIPYPDNDGTPYLEFQTGPEMYSQEHINRFIALTNDPHFRAEIGTSKSMMLYQFYEYVVKESAGEALMVLIKNYYPDVQILYKDLGIIGTSIDGFDDVGAISTPMIKSDIKNSIWEIDLYLKKGVVKFRCRDSWTQNWGGDTFPEGKGYHDGPDIRVNEAGNYHITFDLINKTYKFEKLDD